MGKENRLLVFCVWAETEKEGWGKHSCEDRSDTSTRGSKVTDSACTNNGCHSLSSLSLSLSLSPSPQRVTLAPASGEESIHLLTRQLNWPDITPPVSGAFISAGLLFCVGLDYGPLAPRGQLSLEWDNSQTRPCTHGNTLRGYYASRTPFSGFIF